LQSSYDGHGTTAGAFLISPCCGQPEECSCRSIAMRYVSLQLPDVICAAVAIQAARYDRRDLRILDRI
jgi:hypothetical protein